MAWTLWTCWARCWSAWRLHLRLTPQEKPGLFQQLAEAKSREIEAVAFAFRHDDGQNVEELHRAEVVLVGVSRTMKTPTMLYLAYRGWFAANVPLIPELPLPKPLLALPPERVFCLCMQPEQLRERRHARATIEAIPLEPYASLPQVSKEHQYAERLCERNGWRVSKLRAIRWRRWRGRSSRYWLMNGS